MAGYFGKKLRCGLGAFLILGMLTGCGGSGATLPQAPLGGQKPSASMEKEEEDLKLDRKLIEGMKLLQSRDNSLDLYSCVRSGSLELETAPGESAFFNGSVFLPDGAAGMYVVSDKSGETLRVEWVFLDGQGQRRNVVAPDLRGGRPGEIAGSNHHMMSTVDENESGTNRRYFYELDENLAVVREIPIDQYDGRQCTIHSMQMDAAQNYHMISAELKQVEDYWVASRESEYMVFSAAGELIGQWKDSERERIQELCTIYDGRTAFVTADFADEKMGDRRTIRCWDPETEGFAELASLEWNTDYFENPWYECTTMLDEKTLLYADSVGLYRLSLDTKESEALYRWGSHGLLVSNVQKISAAGGGIHILYLQGKQEHYLYLEPTAEEVEQTTIKMAVPSWNYAWYQKAVAMFHRQYPSCHIELETDPDETVLLTTLTAGDGPVLIDTALLSFAEHKTLWQPLGNLLEELGIAQDMIPQAMDCGRIGDSVYGIVLSFGLETLVAKEQSLTGWDYETFLQYIQEHPAKAVLNDEYSGASTFLSCLIHGMEDNYFLDAGERTTIFGSERFDRLLDVMAPYYPVKEPISWESALQDERVLCTALSLMRPREVALCRVLLGEDVRYVGFPNQTGAGHYIRGGDPICIRRTATDEEKQLALAFLDLLLSYDCQMEASEDLNFHFSVRRDVLERQFMTLTEETIIPIAGAESIALGEKADAAKDLQSFMALVENAQPERSFPKELSDILWEEWQDYENGVIDRKILSDHLKNRVELYLNER